MCVRAVRVCARARVCVHVCERESSVCVCVRARVRVRASVQCVNRLHQCDVEFTPLYNASWFCR